jgi:hypothetical protein
MLVRLSNCRAIESNLHNRSHENRAYQMDGADHASGTLSVSAAASTCEIQCGLRCTRHASLWLKGRPMFVCLCRPTTRRSTVTRLCYVVVMTVSVNFHRQVIDPRSISYRLLPLLGHSTAVFWTTAPMHSESTNVCGLTIERITWHLIVCLTRFSGRLLDTSEQTPHPRPIQWSCVNKPDSIDLLRLSKVYASSLMTKLLSMNLFKWLKRTVCLSLVQTEALSNENTRRNIECIEIGYATLRYGTTWSKSDAIVHHCRLLICN